MSPRQSNTDAVWVDVIPSMVGFGADLAKEASGAGTRAGTAVAVELERVAEQAGRDAGQRLGSGIAAAQARVDQLGAALRDARHKEEDAAGKVRIAEEKLNEVRARGEKASGSQVAAAEEALAAARRKSAAAADNSTRSAKALERAEQAAAEATDDVVESIDTGGRGLGDYAGQLGGAAKAAAGFAIAAAGVGSAVDLIGQAVDNTDVNAVLSAQLGATPQMAAEFGQIAGDLYAKNYGESLQAVSEGLRAVYQSGALAEDATSEQLDRITGRALNLQKTFSVDVAESMRSVGVLMRTGMAPDAEFALDLVTSGFQNGLNVAGDFLETLNEYSTQFRKLGLDGQTSLGLIRQGLRAGARDTDVVADAIKEFAIRAIDGSTSTSAAYKTLGLDATATAQQIARGGEGASAGLQLVLDRLRGITDPVLQAQAAVGLFGTKAEDLGAALYALNPATAVDALGNVAGAAQRMGDTLAGSPAANLQQFGRELQTWAVDLLGGKVIPILADVVGWLRDDFAPALIESGQWVQRNKDWLIPLVIVLGTFAVAYKTIAVVTDLWAKRTLILAAAQWALNAAMTANPVGLIIAGIAALIAGIVWIATQTTWFQDVWAFAWGWIKAIAVAGWQDYLKPAFEGIVTAVTAVGAAALWLWREAIVPATQAIGTAASWLWSNVLQPVFSFIDGAVRILAAVIITLFVTPAVLAFRLLAAAAMWLWSNAIQPAFLAIAAAATWLYATAIKPVIDLHIAAFQLLAAGAMWLWTNGIKPSFDGIAAGANWLYRTVIKPLVDLHIAAFQLLAAAAMWLWTDGIKLAFDGIAAGATWLYGTVIKPLVDLHIAAFQLLAAGAMWLWTNGIKPSFDGIGSIVQWVYDHMIAPAFDGMNSGVSAVGSAFDSAVAWIGRTWDSLKGKLADPVNFLINFVYNDGIRSVWNKVAGFVGVAELPRVDPIKFAGGGFVVPGYAPGVDTVPSLLSRGESVLVPELTRAIGPENIMAANYAASGRRGTVAGGRGVARFAGGGVVGDLLGWVPGIGDDLKALWTDPRGWVASRLGGASGIADLIAAVPEKLIGSAVDWLSEKMSSFFSSSAGGGDLGKWIAAAMQITGVSPNWAGPLNTLIMRESGGNPNAINLWDSNAQAGHPSQGLMQTIPGTFAAYRDPRLPDVITDPVANIVAGINYIKARYGTIFNVQQAVGTTPLGYDSGGYLQPGLQLVYNGTGKPEPVLTPEQFGQLGRPTTMTASLVDAVIEVGEDGLMRFVDGRIDVHDQTTASALNHRRR